MRRAVLAIILGSALAGSAAAQSRQDFSLIERGRYLAQTGDCVACHTAPGGKPFAGGLALETPFGTILTPNITPDRDTGIGAWTDDEFIASMHDGIGRGGYHLYPAMPYPSYTKVSRDDVLAIRTYLTTVEPVDNRVVPNQLPFPFNIRFSVKFWNLVNFIPGRFVPNPNKSEDWNRGAYLVEGLGHCGTCHTPKNILGGDKTTNALIGGTLQGWFAPNITASKHKGIGEWSADDIVQYLKTGGTARTLASGPMAEEIVHSSSEMTDADLKAIAVYLKDFGRDQTEAKADPIPANDRRMIAGQAIYKDNCAACHTDAGTGTPHLFPALTTNAVRSDDATTLIRITLEGSRAISTAALPTAPAMPAFGWRLNDEQIASVLTFIRNTWGNSASMISTDTVRKLRQSLAAGRQ
jgi:mono/diheme cytochrome c family protein